jgi:hypothetical protein
MGSEQATRGPGLPGTLSKGPGVGHGKRATRAAWAAAFAPILLLAGCKVGPNYTRPTYTAPDHYKEAGAV